MITVTAVVLAVGALVYTVAVRVADLPASEPAPGRAAPRAGPLECPHCGARFPMPLKFCGECGKPMSGGTS